MGTSYIFTKLNKKSLLSGNIFSKMPKEQDDCFWDSGDPVLEIIDRFTIGDEMDRTYFIWKLLDTANHKPEDMDPVYSKDWVKPVLENYQIRPVTREMVQHGLDMLKELDAKVSSMPFKKTCKDNPAFFAGIVWNGAVKDDKKWQKEHHTEPCDCEDDDYNKDHSYYGRDAQDVAIVREVAKVYGDKEYKYSYPWMDNSRGSRYVKKNFERMLQEMDDDTEGKYLYFCHWY